MRHHHARRIAVATACVCALAVTAACSSDTDGGPDADAGSDGNGNGNVVEITQWYHEYGEAGTKEAVERYAEEYNASQSSVKVNVVWVPGDYYSKLNASLLAGEGPDIFESAPVGERIFAGQVAPLDDIFGDALSDFNPNNIASVTVDDHIYGMPTTDGTGLLFYRKSMLADAGVQPPTTMDELIDAASALTRDGRKGLFIGNDGCTSGQLPKIAIWSSGNEIIENGEVVFDNDRTVAAFEKMRELCTSDSLLLGAPTDWYDSSVFIDGLAAMQWGGQWTLPAVEEALGDDFGVVPWPALDSDGEPATWYGGWYEQVNASSPHLDEALAFVKWLWIDNIEAQTEWSTQFGSTAPVRTSIVEATPALNESPAKDFMTAIAQYGHLESGVYWSSAAEAAIGEALNNVVRNGADAAGEVTAAADKVRTELARIESESRLQ